MSDQRKAECIRLSHIRTREMWMERRAREDAAGQSNRLIAARRASEDRIMRGWLELEKSGIERFDEVAS